MFNIIYLCLYFFIIIIYIITICITYIPFSIISLFCPKPKNIKKFNVNPEKYIYDKILKSYPKLQSKTFNKMTYYETSAYSPTNPSLIFIHGSYSSSIGWIETINNLLIANPNLNIFAIDMIGAGLNKSIEFEYDYKKFIDLNKKMLRNFILSKKLIDPILISTSFGGTFNMQYNLDYPTRSIIFNPCAILPLFNKYQWFITFITHYKIINHSLYTFNPTIIYKIGMLFGLDLIMIYHLLIYRTNTFTINANNGIKINLSSACVKYNLYNEFIVRNDIKSKIKLIYSNDDIFVGSYGGKILEKSGFHTEYIEGGHFICENKNIVEILLKAISEPIKFKNISYNKIDRNKKYWMYPSPKLSQNQIDLLINDIKYFY
jgi:hypothetical protein